MVWHFAKEIYNPDGTYAWYLNEFDTILILQILIGIALLALSIIKTKRIISSKTPLKIGLSGIITIGIVSYLLGHMGGVINMIDVFDNIAVEGDIVPIEINNGYSKSGNYTLIGLVLLTVSVIIWGILKGLKSYYDRCSYYC